MDLRRTTIQRVTAAMRSRQELGRCFGCGRRVNAGQPHVRLRGLVFHSGCALYRRRHA